MARSACSQYDGLLCDVKKNIVGKKAERLKAIDEIYHERNGIPGYRKCMANKVFENLFIQNFTTDEPDKIWCTDYIHTLEKRQYAL